MESSLERVSSLQDLGELSRGLHTDPDVDGIKHLAAHPTPKLTSGYGQFTYHDQLGRCVEVFYYLPSHFCPDEDEEESDEEEELNADEEKAGKEDEEDLDGGDTTDADDGEDDDPEDEKYEPELYTSQDVLFVLHGVLRNGKHYCRTWKRHAKKHNILLVCPEFSEAFFPGEQNYNLGSIKGPRKTWAFSAIERIFSLLNRAGIRRSGYHMYGHSAGAQFVHRYVLFMGKTCRMVSAIAANAGWYTFPLTEGPYKYPYSFIDLPFFAASAMDLEQLKLVLSRKLIIMLGQEDSGAKYLRMTDGALAQGVTRFERGMHFFLTVRKFAASKDIPFMWRLTTVPATGHYNARMAVEAAREFFAS